MVIRTGHDRDTFMTVPPPASLAWRRADTTTGHSNTGHSNTGHSNTGHSNTGHREERR